MRDMWALRDRRDFGIASRPNRLNKACEIILCSGDHPRLADRMLESLILIPSTPSCADVVAIAFPMSVPLPVILKHGNCGAPPPRYGETHSENVEVRNYHAVRKCSPTLQSVLTKIDASALVQLKWHCFTQNWSLLCSLMSFRSRPWVI